MVWNISFEVPAPEAREPRPEDVAKARATEERWRERWREEEAALERLRGIPPGFRPMAEMPFADLACANDGGVDAHVLVTDGEKRTLAYVERRRSPVREEGESPPWWHEWRLMESLSHDSDGLHEEVGFVPTLWAPLPR